MGWIRLSLRRLRDDKAPTAGLVVLVLVTTLVAALAPRVLAGLADHAVRAAVDEAPAATRNLVLQRQQLFAPGPPDDPLQLVDATGQSLEDGFPAGIRRLIAGRDAVVESGRFRLQKPTTDPAFIRFRIQEGIGDHVRYVQGRAPTATVERRSDVGPDKLSGVPVFETAVSTQTAEGFGIALGETLTLTGDPTDQLIGRTDNTVYALATITGIYEVPDPQSDYWMDDPHLIHPVIRALSLETQLLDAALLVDDQTHAALASFASGMGRPMRYSWRYFVDPDRIVAERVPSLVVDFRRLSVAFPSANITSAFAMALRTGLLAVLERHQARWVAAQSIFAVVSLGPALVAAAPLALIAILAARRRRSTMTLARSRGASAAQVLVPVLVEGLLLALPAAALATLAAILAVASGRLSTTLLAAGLVVGATLAVLLGTVVGIARAQGPERRPGDRIVTGRIASRRLVFEGLVIVIAAAAAYLLSQRGIRVSSSAGEVAGFDPLVAAVPALAGVAAGILAVRLYPLPLRLAAWLGRRGRGLIPMLAARRAMEGGASAAVLLVLLATATVGSFAAAALDNLDRGAEIAAWQQVGGAYRLETPQGPLPRDLDPATLPGVEVAAGEFQATVPVGLSGPQTLFVAADGPALEAALAGTPSDPGFPGGFTTPGSGPIPAIVSRSLVDAPRGVKAGDVFELSIEGYTLQYRAVDVRDSFPGLPLDRNFVVAAREWFHAQAPAARIAPVVVVIRAPVADAADLRAAVAARWPSVILTSQAETAVALRTSPVTDAVRSGILVAELVTAAYAALGIAAALALAGLARTLEVAHLRTLGLTARQSFGLVFAEHGPTTVASFVAGAVLGIGLFQLLRPALGLADLVGSPVNVPFVLDPGPLLLIFAVMIVVVVAGLVLGAVLQRRVAPTAALRGRFE
jgi:putative ABC transport system permease protein